MLGLCTAMSTQPGHPSVGIHSDYQRKLGSKQAHSSLHNAISLCLWFHSVI